MKFTLGWLHDHLETAQDPAELGAALTDLGHELESLRDPAAALAGFVVGVVVKAEAHPNADRLRVCRVDTGAGEAQVVCGAPNAQAGLRGVFAPPGVRIPGLGTELKAARIRGVESAGMLLSERELGISDNHDEIIALPAEAVAGTPYAVFAGLDDPVFDIGVTPNRPDALGVRGIARDLAVQGAGTLREAVRQAVPGRFASPVGVTLAPEVADQACPLFVGRYFRGLRNGPSPAWMQQRLRAIGLRPISALVDITNYLTMDICRPLHAFDADKLQGDIVVRFARAGETLEALDGHTHTLNPAHVVIADAAGARGLGGVVGGVATACDEGTVNLFLEAAYFDPLRTAATGRNLNIESDARFRFERGVDPASAVWGMEVATQMILDLCGGEASATVLAGAVPDSTRSYTLRDGRVAELLGLEIDPARQREILEGLGFAVSRKSGDLIVQPPSWRPDIGGEADLIEEVARVVSLAQIPATPLPRKRPGVAVPALDAMQRCQTLARRALAARGMHECVCYSFVSRSDAARFGGHGLELENPISQDLSSMRPSVLPALARAAARNVARGARDIGLFEVGPAFHGTEPGAQQRVAGGVRCGDAVPRHWGGSRRPVDAFDAKADLLALVAALGGPARGLSTEAPAPDWYHPGRSGTLSLGRGKVVGHFGALHPDLIAELELEPPVVAFELLLESLPEGKTRRSRPSLDAPNYQAVERDLAFAVKQDIAAETLVRAAERAGRPLLESARIFDLFEGAEAEAGLGAGLKSVAIAIRLLPRDGTLTETQIEEQVQRVVESVQNATGAVLRG